MPRFAVRLAVAAAVALWLPAAAAAQAPPRPNVVVLMTDDQTRASVSFMGNVGRLLAQQGTTFDRAFATFPLCCPSRATFLTGQYAHNHGVIHNAGQFGGYTALDHTNTLPVWLQRAGYRTIQLGRYLNGYGLRNDPAEVPPGWSDWQTSIDPSTFDFAKWEMNEYGRLVAYPRPDRPNEHQTDFYGRRAAELIREAAPSPQPFFLSLNFAAPHRGRPRDPDDPQGLGTPSPALRHRDAFVSQALPRPPNFNEANVRDKPQVIADRGRLTGGDVLAIQENYQQELESLLGVDAAIAAVVHALAESGELENTLIVYTSDNGFFHGEHRKRSEKGLPYEPAIRVPLIIKGPGVPRGLRLRQLVANVDVAPTILAAAGALPGRVQDGRSLFPLMQDPTREWGRDILLENGRGANGADPYRGIRTASYVYVHHISTGEYELYDLERDPYQLRNVADSPRYALVRQALARRLWRLRRCRGAACRARPRLRLSLQGDTRRARSGRRCLASDLDVRVTGRDRRLLGRADFHVNARRVARDGRPPYLRTLPLRSFRRGRTSALRVRALTLDGQILTLDAVVPRCR